MSSLWMRNWLLTVGILSALITVLDVTVGEYLLAVLAAAATVVDVVFALAFDLKMKKEKDGSVGK